MDDHLASPLPDTGATRLADWGLIRASGADARSFLQSQLTQDLNALQSGSACLAGYCSPKGRLLATFVAWPSGADEFLLACSADLLAPTLKRLSMFVMRAKCKLSDASAELALWGVAGAAATGATWPSPWRVVDIGDAPVVGLPPALVVGRSIPRALVVLPAGGALPWLTALPTLAAETWQGLEVRSGVGRIVAATVEQFVPQMINLELVGGVSFSKGCYPGQEVVARSQYRGTLKRRAYVLEGDAALTPGVDVFHSLDPGQPAGKIVLVGTLPGAPRQALAELKIAATESGELRYGDAQGALLQVGQLPYALTAAE